MKLTGSKILLESLQKEGVDVIFGYPGGAVLYIYEALFDSPIRHVLSRHEQGAVHAADGYARASGKVGVALVTSGPGATNAVTGIATAYMDSIPMVIISGQVPSPLIGNDAFQEADIVGITRPCTKHNYLVKNVHELARIIKEAFYIARTGRPGPVLVDIPKDVSAAVADFVYPDQAVLAGYNPTYKGHSKQIEKALEHILKAKRPVLYSGGGIILSSAAKELAAFAHFLEIPVTNTLMGLGGFPGTDRLFLGMLGMHGTYEANMAVTECDVLISVGARFDDRVTGKISEFAPHAEIVHIDIDPTSISKSVEVDIPIVGDARDVLKEMLKSAKKVDAAILAKKRSEYGEWLEHLMDLRQKFPMGYSSKGESIKPQYVIEKIGELTKGKAIIATEVGQHQMWSAQFLKFNEPRSFLTSGGLGTMGYGFPAAIGAQMAFPDRLVIDIAGDGSIQMNIQELATAMQYRLPIKIVILNNSFLGMVRQWQELFHGGKYSSTCMTTAPDFVKLAEAYGAVGLRATKKNEVEQILNQGLGNGQLTIMEFVIEREENVYPMVPAGKGINEMLLI